MASPGVRPLDLQGHRGARGLEPENTLPAFARALEIGVTTLELDLGVTRDGVLVVSHDRRLHPDHARDASGAWIPGPGPTIRSLSFAELQRYDVGRLRPGSLDALRFPEQHARDGVRVPALREVVELTRRAGSSEVRFNVETKLDPRHPEEAPGPEEFADLVVAFLRAEGLAARATVQSFDWRTLRRVQENAPDIVPAALPMVSGGDDNVQAGRAEKSPWLAGLRAGDFAGSAPRLVHALGAPVWSPDARDLTRESLAQAHERGLRVVTWTVNDAAHLDAVIELGVDGVISDYPDRLRQAAARHGLPLPPPTPPGQGPFDSTRAPGVSSERK
jgi:glycerophosphoryl diester phosphodiesterase